MNDYYDDEQFQENYPVMEMEGDARGANQRMEEESILGLFNACLHASTLQRRSSGNEDPGDKKESGSASSEVWEGIRNWLRKHSVDEACEAAKVRGGARDSTPLHLVCESSPPVDIVEVLLRCAPECARLEDANRRLALHYACAKSSDAVVQMVWEVFEEGAACADVDGRTPLHFALGRTENPISAEIASLLILDGDLVSVADNNGYIPLHFACAYGAIEEVVEMLIAEDSNTILAQNEDDRTPLHFLMGNCDRHRSHSILDILLKTRPGVVNNLDKSGKLAIELLGIRAKDIDPNNEEARRNAMKCLTIYLNAKPDGCTELFTALQSLPNWLLDSAVVLPVVQKILNTKISERFPTAVRFLDMYCYISVIVLFSICVQMSLDKRTNAESGDNKISINHVIVLYLCALYFFGREMVQVVSLVRLQLFDHWTSDYNNYIDVIFILLIVFWSFVMTTGMFNIDFFRIGAAVTLFYFYLNFLRFLQSLIVDFAVFVTGVLHVIARLTSFMTALVIILVGFMQAFNTEYRATAFCLDSDTYGNEDIHLFCSYWPSFLKVYTMLLGEVDDHIFKTSAVATALFAIFMFTVVILLANVLIAIVTDSYAVIRDERSQIVFWTNRLDFVSEMDAISSNIVLRGMGNPWWNSTEGLSNLWERLVEILLEDDMNDMSDTIFDRIVLFILQILAALFIPLWIVSGLFSAGYLWPPQVRDFLFKSSSGAGERGQSAAQAGPERALQQVKAINKDLEDWNDKVRASMLDDRQKISDMKSQLLVMKSEVGKEIKAIKEVVELLFEQS